MSKKPLMLSAATAALAVTMAFTGVTAAQAQGVSDDAVKIGVIVDMTGVYSGNGGKAVVVASQMAAEDFGGTVLGKPIEIVSADYQNKVDITSSTVRRWFDQDKVDMVLESTDSASAIAIQKLGAERKRITIAAGSASTALTNAECSPYGIHYVYDTYALATGTGRAVVEEGGKRWFFLTADYAFGHSLEKNTTDVVKAMGGTVVGGVRHPLNSADFASYLLQAQSSGAEIVALANAGTDFSNALKQAQEFGLTDSGQSIAAMLVFLSDLKALGPDVAKGVKFTTGFYWDYNDETRAFSERFFKRFGTMPTDIQAGAYSAVTTYLNAIKAVGTDDADKVRAHLRTVTINDFFAKDGKIRDDGRMVHEMYLAEAKAPAEVKSPWDLAKVLRPIPGDDAYQPLERSTCPLVKKS
ncbi:ABC transporter substrate-binding protein [Azospirillum agricola]|uniref:ABC transporter substrate-binding protein n=1 Tax=Azospirillum agricola TaxID=1720247 RepID=UPI000A0EEE0F|nr:ABC transporter substrate-binding protein [Azospirillum agricola]SMH31335.1 amino acid/amide ABC transporter substrate-binding protein, HAAT family [Azospirillum lipoferum]